MPFYSPVPGVTSRDDCFKMLKFYGTFVYLTATFYFINQALNILFVFLWQADLVARNQMDETKTLDSVLVARLLEMGFSNEEASVVSIFVF